MTARAPIRKLPEAVINQIAAGEVVERPAAALKELLENALDAGATRVRIEASSGGTGLLAIEDDGSGIPADELPLALERHATSKLRGADELAAVASFGFRGEALASIASVSRFTLISGTDSTKPALEVRADGGALQAPRPAPPRRGTRVETRDLFYNAAARRRFLRAPSTELGHLQRAVEEAALAHPGVAFIFLHEGEIRLERPAESAAARAAGIFGRPVREFAAAGVWGFAADPGSRRSRGELHTFVNRRPVKDRLLTRAVLDALRDLHPDGEQPDLAIFLELPAGTVDVNVHPQKREVRFADPQSIYKKIRTALRGELDHPDDGHDHTHDAHGHAPATRAAPETLARVAEAAAQAWASHARPGESTVINGKSYIRLGINIDEGDNGNWLHGAPAGDREPQPSLFGPGANLRFLGTLFDTYFLAADAEKIYLVDQHALHERALYEQLRRGARFTPQPLLTPVELSAGPEAAARAARWPGWATLGFAVEQGGPRSLLLTALPAELKGVRAEALAEIILGEGFSHGAPADPDPAAFLRELLATRACKSAVKAGDPLPFADIAALLTEAVASKIPPACPHGRPVVIVLEKGEIETRFRRRG